MLSRKVHWRAHLAGAALLAAGSLLLIAAGARFVDSETPIGPLARIFDSLAPWLLVGTLVICGPAALLGARRGPAVLAIGAVVAAGHLVVDHRKVSLPLTPDRDASVRIVFLNALFTNLAYAHRIVDAAKALDPDVIVFAEGKALYPALRQLGDGYAFVSDCELEECEVLVATKREPVRFWRLSLNPVWPDRYAVAELKTKAGQRYFVAASQVLKPWFSGVSEPEMERLGAQYDWLPGPVIAVGDFNAAPWSAPMQQLLKHTGFRTLRTPMGTWPAVAGALGVPIDQILVHEGARVVDIQPFGEGLNSNHRGFVADVALP